MPPKSYEKIEAERRERQRERYQRLANNERRRLENSQRGRESSSVHNSINRLLRSSTLPSLPRLEPLLESTPQFSKRRNESKRKQLKEAAKKAAVKARSNILKASPVFVNNRGAAAGAGSSKFTRSNSGSSLSSLSNENNYSNGFHSNGFHSNGSHSNVSQERGLLGSLNLLNVPVVVNVPKSKKHRNILKARNMNKQFREMNNA